MNVAILDDDKDRKKLISTVCQDMSLVSQDVGFKLEDQDLLNLLNSNNLIWVIDINLRGCNLREDFYDDLLRKLNLDPESLRKVTDLWVKLLRNTNADMQSPEYMLSTFLLAFFDVTKKKEVIIVSSGNKAIGYRLLNYPAFDHSPTTPSDMELSNNLSIILKRLAGNSIDEFLEEIGKFTNGDFHRNLGTDPQLDNEDGLELVKDGLPIQYHLLCNLWDIDRQTFDTYFSPIVFDKTRAVYSERNPLATTCKDLGTRGTQKIPILTFLIFIVAVIRRNSEDQDLKTRTIKQFLEVLERLSKFDLQLKYGNIITDRPSEMVLSEYKRFYNLLELLLINDHATEKFNRRLNLGSGTFIEFIGESAYPNRISIKLRLDAENFMSSLNRVWNSDALKSTSDGSSLAAFCRFFDSAITNPNSKSFGNTNSLRLVKESDSIIYLELMF